MDSGEIYTTGSHGVLQWSLSGTLWSYKGLQYRVKGLAGSQGTVQWSLDGIMGPNDVLRCHKRGYIYRLSGCCSLVSEWL